MVSKGEEGRDKLGIQDEQIYTGGGLVAKLCPTLATSQAVCSLPGSSVHGILWASTLEWAAISSHFNKIKINKGILR